MNFIINHIGLGYVGDISFYHTYVVVNVHHTTPKYCTKFTLKHARKVYKRLAKKQFYEIKYFNENSNRNTSKRLSKTDSKLQIISSGFETYFDGGTTGLDF